MPFDANPVIQRLKRQIRIGRCLDLDYHEAPIGCHAQQINNVSFLANKARHLRVNVPNINGRKYLADTANEIGLQPPLLVSVCERMPAAVPPQLADLFHYLFDWFSQRVADAFVRYARDFQASESPGDRSSVNMRNGLDGSRGHGTNPLDFGLDVRNEEILKVMLRVSAPIYQR